MRESTKHEKGRKKGSAFEIARETSKRTLLKDDPRKEKPTRVLFWTKEKNESSNGRKTLKSRNVVIEVFNFANDGGLTAGGEGL